MKIGNKRRSYLIQAKALERSVNNLDAYVILLNIRTKAYWELKHLRKPDNKGDLLTSTSCLCNSFSYTFRNN